MWFSQFFYQIFAIFLKFSDYWIQIWIQNFDFRIVKIEFLHFACYVLDSSSWIRRIKISISDLDSVMRKTPENKFKKKIHSFWWIQICGQNIRFSKIQNVLIFKLRIFCSGPPFWNLKKFYLRFGFCNAINIESLIFLSKKKKKLLPKTWQN